MGNGFANVFKLAHSKKLEQRRFIAAKFETQIQGVVVKRGQCTCRAKRYIGRLAYI